MKKSALLALVATLALSACGGDEPSTTPTETGDTTGTANGEIGVAKTATDIEGNTAEITIDAVLDPVSPPLAATEDSRYVALELTVTNTSEVAISELVRTDAELFVAEDAESIIPSFLATEDCEGLPDENTEIAPGASLSGCPTYEVPIDATLDRLEFALSAGFGEKISFSLA